jgi:hypothetical protein
MKKRRYVMSGLVALWLVLVVPFSVHAADEIGKITRIRGTAHVLRKTVEGPIAASEGMPVYLNDEVRTAARSSVRIELKDQSILTLGPQGLLQLNHFEFEPEAEKRSALFDMFKGKLRVFARDLETYQEKDFKIKTPTAICGVRGTLFLVWVQSDTVTKVYCFKNKIEVANTFKPEDVIVLAPDYGTDVLLKTSPSTPVFTTPQQQLDMVRDLGEMQGTEQPAGEAVQSTPKVPVSGQGYASGGLPALGGDVARDAAGAGGPGAVPGTPGSTASTGGSPVSSGVEGQGPAPSPPGTLPGPPGPPPQDN